LYIHSNNDTKGIESSNQDYLLENTKQNQNIGLQLNTKSMNEPFHYTSNSKIKLNKTKASSFVDSCANNVLNQTPTHRNSNKVKNLNMSPDKNSNFDLNKLQNNHKKGRKRSIKEGLNPNLPLTIQTQDQNTMWTNSKLLPDAHH